MVQAMARELELQQHYLEGDLVHTIYVGGGTPSLLSEAEINQLLEAVYQHFSVVASPEVTVEANPDDLDRDTLAVLRRSGINRLSVGIQSFHEPHLRYLNRSHGAGEAVQSVQQAQAVGFDNISIDLIYAIPAEHHTIWRRDLAQAVALQPQHISAYCLTIEEKTVFGHWQRQGKLREMSDTFATEQFNLLVSTLSTANYDPYEVSNFCQPGYYSQHNTNYWRAEKYLGIGPSAHSFNGHSRQYNVAHNVKYLRSLARGQVPYEQEILSRYDRINELIMTGLRTKWGCNLKQLKEQYQYDLHQAHSNYLDKLITDGKAYVQEDYLRLTLSGRLWADGIAEALFILYSD